MRVLNWNAAGISTKGDDLQALLSQSKADVCVLTETWLRGHPVPTIWPQAQINDPPAVAGRPAGGVAVLVRPGHRFKVIRRLNQKGISALWVRFPGEFDLIATYARPNLAC